MRTQTCPRCAQAVWVEAFAPGTPVACGGCGHVLVVQAPVDVAPLVPPPPPVARPAPGPPARPAPAPPPPLRPALAGEPPPGRRVARRRRLLEGRRSQALALGLGLGALALAGLVAALAPSRPPDRPPPPPPTTPEARAAQAAADEQKAVAELALRYARQAPGTAAEFRPFLAQVALLERRDRVLLKRIYEDYVAGPGADDAAARTWLGHVRFDGDVPPEITFRAHGFVRLVERAAAQRWFASAADPVLEAARRALAECEKHAERLQTDRVYRAVDQLLANVAAHPNLKDYNYATHWAEPYLICYSSAERLSEYDLYTIEDPAERERRRAELAARRAAWQPTLEAKGRLFQFVHEDFLQRYGKAFDLRPLMAEWGGRPEYPVGQRSFADGCPLLVWIFSDHAAFLEHHSAVLQDEIHPSVGGYFDPRSGHVFLFDESDDREFEVMKAAHEAVHQLMFWFAAQGRSWARPERMQTGFDEGLAEWLGAVRLGPNGRFERAPYNTPRLRGFQRLKRQIEAAGRPYPLLDVRQLTAFQSYYEVAAWFHEQHELPPDVAMPLFYEQAWALVHFLNLPADPTLQAGFERLVGLHLGHGDRAWDREGAFARAFGLKTAEDWERVDRAYKAFVKGTLWRIDPGHPDR